MSSKTDKVLFKRNDKDCFGRLKIIMQSFLSSSLAPLCVKNNWLGSNRSDVVPPPWATPCLLAVSQSVAIRKTNNKCDIPSMPGIFIKKEKKHTN